MADLGADFLKQYSRLGSMKPEQLAAFQKRLEAVVTLFGKGTKDAQLYEKMLENVNKKLSSVSTSSSGLHKSLDGLITKFSEMDKGAGAAGKLAENTLKSVFSLDKATGNMKALGVQTNMTAAQFSNILGLARGIAIVGTAYLNTLVNLQKKEAEYIKAAGGRAGEKIDVGTQYDIKARGLAIAGNVGAEIAEKTAVDLMSARRGVFETLSGQDLDRLVRMQASERADMGPIQQRLISNFGVGSGATETQARGLVDMLTRLGASARNARLPLEEYSGAVLDLSEQFITSGVELTDVEAMIQRQADAWSEGKLQRPVLMNAVGTALSQATTAGGLTPGAATGVLLQKTFGQLSESAQQLLNASAEGARGVAGTKFTQLNALEISSALRDLKETRADEFYGVVLKSFKPLFEDMFGRGKSPGETREIMMQVAPQILGMEFPQFEKAVKSFGPGGKTAEEINTDTLRVMADYDQVNVDIARGQKELTSAIWSLTNTLKQGLAKFFGPEVIEEGAAATPEAQAAFKEIAKTSFRAPYETRTGGTAPEATETVTVPANTPVNIKVTVEQSSLTNPIRTQGTQNNR